MSPSERSSDNPLLAEGPNVLSKLYTHCLLDDGASLQVSSRYQPRAEGDGAGEFHASSSAASPSRKGTNQQNKAASSVPEELGTWQIVAGRTGKDGLSWYEASLDGAELRRLCNKGDCKGFHELEIRLVQAFSNSDFSIGILPKYQDSDGSWSRVILIIGDPTEKALRVTMFKQETQRALLIATHLSAELMVESKRLHQVLKDRQAKLDRSRKLVGIPNAPAHQRIDGSLVNPGRVKRKHEDDEGFEDAGTSQEKLDSQSQMEEEEEVLTVPARKGMEAGSTVGSNKAEAASVDVRGRDDDRYSEADHTEEEGFESPNHPDGESDNKTSAVPSTAPSARKSSRKTLF